MEKKILVIDDADYIVSEIKKIFEGKKGYKVVGPKSVTSYQQAMELVSEHKPYAIALDMSLTDSGNKEGIDIAARIYYGGIPSIVSVISSYDVDDVMGWVGQYGVRHYAGGKDAKKFAECVLGECECSFWREYLELGRECNSRKTSKELTQRVLISARSKMLAIAVGKSILAQSNGREDVMVRLVKSDSLTYYMELDSGVPLRIVSDFVGEIQSEKISTHNLERR